ncbi:hypothetical protein M3223_02985 [Paenibacillus pasadenensis]|nr:hypothetical protein [Paenibacillus pasadenensis]
MNQYGLERLGTARSAIKRDPSVKQEAAAFAFEVGFPPFWSNSFKEI